MENAIKEKKISSIFNYYPLVVLKPTEAQIASVQAWARKEKVLGCFEGLLTNTPKIIPNQSVIGVEVEAENVFPEQRLCLPPGWLGVHDNSLRNEGLEFITRPASPEMARIILCALFARMKAGQESRRPQFNWRTSIHIHLNVRNEKIESLCNLLLLYILCEDSFFAFAGESRRENNFCVPITETSLSCTIARFLQNAISLPTTLEIWQKYCALNPRPIIFSDHHDAGQGSAKGTVEFRHLAGTYELGQIITWINLIISLQNFSRQISIEALEESIVGITSKEHFSVFLQGIFGDLLPVKQDFRRIMFSSLSYVKECFCPVVSLSKMAEETKGIKTGLSEMIKLRTRFANKAAPGAKSKKLLKLGT